MKHGFIILTLFKKNVLHAMENLFFSFKNESKSYKANGKFISRVSWIGKVWF